MNAMNHTMKILMKNRVEKTLPMELKKIAKNGFIDKNGCVFLKELANRQTNVNLDDFIDKTGYECFINSLHIDDYVESNFLSYALVFVFELFERWKKNKNLQAIISVDEFGAVVKLHKDRVGESWIGGNIEDYEEAILAIDSQYTIKSFKEMRLFD